MVVMNLDGVINLTGNFSNYFIELFGKLIELFHFKLFDLWFSIYTVFLIEGGESKMLKVIFV